MGTYPVSEGRGKIAGLSLVGCSLKEIARALHHGRTAVNNYLENGSGYKENSWNSGRKAKLTQRVRRSILRLADDGRLTSRKTKESPQFDVNT